MVKSKAAQLGWKVRECRSCGGLIVWARTLRRRMMPVDAEPRSDGNLVLFGEASSPMVRVVRGEGPAPGELRWASHFVTCPLASEWRRRPR